MIDMKKEPWISANEAAQIISENSGKPVHPDYVRLLARQNPKKLASKPLDGRTNVYLRTDVEQIKVKTRRVSNREVPDREVPDIEPIPIAQIDENVSAGQKSYQQMPLPEPLQIRNVEASSDIPIGLPSGCLNLKQFVDSNGIPESKFRQWMKEGVGGDQLERSYYMSNKNIKSVCFTTAEQAINLMILRKHGKLK